MERREAQGSRAEARAPRDPTPSRYPWVPEAWRESGPPSVVRSRAPHQALWRLPALHPLVGKRKGNDAPDVAKQPAGGALAV